MKKIKTMAALISIAAFLFGMVPVYATERIIEHTVELTPYVDGSMQVDEYITYDFDINQKRGIFRNIPLNAEINKKAYRIEISDVIVQKQGVSEIFKTYTEDGDFVIQTGNEEVYITGTHEYHFQYTVDNALIAHDDFVWLSWNAIGTGWKVSSDAAMVVLNNSHIKPLAVDCWYGVYESDNRCIIQEEIATENMQIVTTLQLRAGEAVTIEAQYSPELFTTLIDRQSKWWYSLMQNPWFADFSKNPIAGIGGIVMFIFSAIIIISKIRLAYAGQTGKVLFQKTPDELVQYEPPEHFDAVWTGVCIDGRLDMPDFLAGIFELAQKGYIKIKKEHSKRLFLTSQNITIELLKPIDNKTGSATLTEIGNILFAHQIPGAVLDLKTKSSKIHNQFTHLQRKIDTELIANGVRKKKNLIQAVFRLSIPRWKIGLGAGLGALLFGGIFGEEALRFLAESNIVFIIFGVFIIAFAFSEWKSWTEKGKAIKTHLLGFKRYLMVVEKDRMEFHAGGHAQDPDLFYKYLPHAIALGVSTSWARHFKDITIPQPDWYESDMDVFTVGMLAQDIRILNNAATQIIIPQASSGGRSVGGGGFSGGGSGGGGGGSW